MRRPCVHSQPGDPVLDGPPPLMRFTVGSRVGRYDILDELGEGAYAETYLARDADHGRLVVLKVPNPDLFADPAIFQRYRREAEIARSLDHPGVQRAFAWMATMAGHLTKTPDAPEHRRRDIPPGLSAVVMHAMRRYPDHRYQHMTEALDDLDHVDTVAGDRYDRSPEAAMGGMAAAGSTTKMWLAAVGIAFGIVALCAVIVLVSVAL